MKYGELFTLYFLWHYGRSFENVLNAWGNFIWFLYHFFSIGLLTRTFFAPWHRLDEHAKTGLHVEAFLENVVANTLMRLIGMLARLFVIASGILAIALTLVFGCIAFIVWALLPLTVLMLIITGAMFIIF